MDERFKKISEAEKILNKQFATTNSLVRLGDKVGVLIPSIATGLPTFDFDVTGTGGVPRGRIIEIFGPESAGKTTMALHIIGCEQEHGGLAAFVDAEHALDPTYAAMLGVDVDNLVVSQPDYGEQALEIVLALLDTGVVSLIVVDSVAALTPKAELDGEMGDSHMGLQARLMSQAMRKLVGTCARNNATVIFINQLREKIGVMFGSPEITTGGKALKFYASVRYDIRRLSGSKGIIEDDKMIGHELKIKAVKNKVATPFEETTVRLMYGTGLDLAYDKAEYAVKHELIAKSGAWFQHGGKNIAHGMDQLAELIRTDTTFAVKLESESEAYRESKRIKRD